MRAAWLERPWGRMRLWEGGLSGGPGLLAIHGLGGSGRYWQGLEDLAGDRFAVIAPDLAGFGSSAKPRDVEYDRELHLADLEAVAARVADPVVVVGHSLGGVLALLWAGRRPGRVAALCLAGTPYPQPKQEWDPSRWTGARAAVPAAVSTTARIAWPVLSLPAQAFSKYPGAVVRDYGRQTMRSRSWTLWSLWADPDLERLVLGAAGQVDGRVPVQILHAADDRSVRPTAHRRWSDVLPRADHRLLEHGGHQFLLHQRFEPLRGWLDGLRVGEPG